MVKICFVRSFAPKKAKLRSQMGVEVFTTKNALSGKTMSDLNMHQNALLSRDTFRESIFHRDLYKCVICGQKAQDAHHIIERRLFTTGGYYLDNGASLCGSCHILAETTEISCDKIREAAGIQNIILPTDFHSDLPYDKWGNIMLAEKRRLKGALFKDDSFQKIIAKDIIFEKYIFPPKILPNPYFVYEEEVVVTPKIEGKFVFVYDNYAHSDKLDIPIRKYNRLQPLVDIDMCFCILETPLLGSFLWSIWEDGTCLSWKEMVEYAAIMEMRLPPILYQGQNPLSFLEQNPPKQTLIIRHTHTFDLFSFRNNVVAYLK